MRLPLLTSKRGQEPARIPAAMYHRHLSGDTPSDWLSECFTVAELATKCEASGAVRRSSNLYSFELDFTAR